MAGGCGTVRPFSSLWLCLVGLLFLRSPVWTINLHASAPTVYSGPDSSYFGFALDFYQDSKGSMNIVVGAPRANTSQPDVIEAGYVYLCPWEPSGRSCTPIPFDTKGDQKQQYATITARTFKSKQWFGASVHTWKDSIVACAPLQHWNAFDNNTEATKTPVGSCFVASKGLQHIDEYSPCRRLEMHSMYRMRRFINDNRYCEAGFSLAISDSGKLLLGAPGGYYFSGLIYSVNLSAIQASFHHSHSLVKTVNQQHVTREFMDASYDDAYRGYSVAFGEFNEDSASPEYVVGVPNKSLTQGVVEILSLKQTLRVLWTLSSEQVASYFGHTVAVADINRDGKDDILVGAPLFMERRSDRKLYEVGRVYLYLQRKIPHPYSTPWQAVTGTDVYGRFGMAISSLGDVDQDGYTDIAVGAPFAGKDGSGRVYVYRGCNEGLSASPNQILESPFSGPAGFGFAIRGASDIDANGYPDMLIGAYGANKVAVYRAQPVVIIKAQLDMPDVLNPEEKMCKVSGAQVSCFTIQMCVGASGKSIPQKIDLNAELQLDRMKQKFGRRVFLRQTSQSSRVFPLQVMGNLPQVCQNVTAYLQNEADFKDKLSPIVVSLNFSLASNSTAGELQPVLYGQMMIQEQTRIILDCGEDNICIPDLRLSAHTAKGSFLFIGAENVILIRATARNDGDGAYETELVVQLPRGAYFQQANSSAQALICNSHKENDTRLVTCEVGNPMKNGTEIKVDVEIGISHLEEAGDTVKFTLQLKSKNSHNSSSQKVELGVPVKVATSMKLLGNSAPAVIVVPPILGDHKNKSRRVNDYGPKVEHIYQLENEGPSTISGAELLVEFPNRFSEDFLLYITEVSPEGNITCSPSNATNSLKLEVQEPTTALPYNATAQPMRWRGKRDLTSETEQTALEPIVVDCSSHVCDVIRCQVGSLEKSHRVTVTIHAVLWLQTFQKYPLKPFNIQSRALFNVSGMPYHIQPESLPSGSALAKLLVEQVNPDAKRNIPAWWIIGAVLAGLLLLAALIIIFWKLGFFKRTRPPTEDEQQLTNDTEPQSAGQGQ